MVDRLAAGYNFLLCLGNLTISFSKITGIGNEVNVTSFSEGGVNDRAIVLYAPKQNGERLVFEHGIGIMNPVNAGFEAARLGYYLRLPGTILTFTNRKISRVYGYSGAKPVKWSVSGLDAQNSGILIDTVEIIHDGIFEIPYNL